MSMQDDEDLDLVEQGAMDAHRALSAARTGLDKAQVDGVKERAQYFEKLTIGSGATIAALVSYLGSHVLYPKWILRFSLVSLGVVMVAALYRTWTFPAWVATTKFRILTKAKLADRRYTHKLSELREPDNAPRDLGNLGDQIHALTKSEHRLWIGIRCSEFVCLVALGISMVALVWLAVRNF